MSLKISQVWPIYMAIMFISFNLVSSLPANCEDQTSCDTCIGVAGCTWCKELRDPYNPIQRCNTLQKHRANKCQDILVSEPAERTITHNPPITKTSRIQPQGATVKFGVGQEIQIDLSYNDSSDRQLDLYYIMDLSATMEDDKENVSKQAHSLVGELEKITKDVRIGFGSFIDKPLLPYVSSAHLRPSTNFATPYGFKNELSLTKDIPKFVTVVKNAKISRNLDEPEGTLDALMQAIVCKSEIGWRETARKLIVVATDGPFHIAGDGKLGGIVRANDLKCHMENNFYTHSTLLDYPSIGEINSVILEHKVYVIFAISTEEGDKVFKMYDELQNHVTQSTAERLNVDSSNVVQKIRKKYLEISGRVEANIDAPSFVDVVVLAKCTQKGIYEPQSHCNDVGVGNKIDFRIKLTLRECPDQRTGYNQKNKVTVSFFELSEKLVIDLSYACKCKCSGERNENENNLERYCNGRNATRHISCGTCACKDDRYGDSCQCSRTNDNEQGDRSGCVNNNRPDSVECSDRGECKCGKCVCQQDYNGEYCEHSTQSCQNKRSQFPKRICSDNGQCRKGECVCYAGFSGQFCECEDSAKTACVEPGNPLTNLCNGHGSCECNGNQAQCKCYPNYSGPYCEVCKINCSASGSKQRSRCGDKFIQQCIRCKVKEYSEEKKSQCLKLCDRKTYLGKESGKSKEDTKAEMNRKDVDEYIFLQRQSLSDEPGIECRLNINNTCTTKFKYTYQKGTSHNDALQIYYAPNEIVCMEEPNLLWYMIGVILAVLLAGILALLIWKLATHLHDKKEYRKFEKEIKQAKWHTAENPLFKSPMTNFQNDAYRNSFRS